MSGEKKRISGICELSFIAPCSSLLAHGAAPRQNCVAYHFPRCFGQPGIFRSEKRKKPQGKRLSLLPFADLGSSMAELLARVLVGINALAHMVGFMIELALVVLREMAIILSHIAFFVILQALFAALQMGSLAGREFVVLHAVGDAILLVGFTAVDLIHARMAGIDLARPGAGRVLSLRSGRSDNHQTTHCKD